jgi:epoxyqueuosine reductase
MKRAKLPGLRRNAAVAMGNRGEERYISALGAVLEDAALEEGDNVVRRHAAWALGKIGGETAREVLAVALECTSETMLREEILAALKKIPTDCAEGCGGGYR